MSNPLGLPDSNSTLTFAVMLYLAKTVYELVRRYVFKDRGGCIGELPVKAWQAKMEEAVKNGNQRLGDKLDEQTDLMNKIREDNVEANRQQAVFMARMDERTRHGI